MDDLLNRSQQEGRTPFDIIESIKKSAEFKTVIESKSDVSDPKQLKETYKTQQRSHFEDKSSLRSDSSSLGLFFVVMFSRFVM